MIHREKVQLQSKTGYSRNMYSVLPERVNLLTTNGGDDAINGIDAGNSW